MALMRMRLFALLAAAISVLEAFAEPEVVCPGTNDFTLSCWFRLGKGQKGGTVLREKKDGGWVELIIQPNEVRFWTGRTAFDFAHTVRYGKVKTGVWHHLASLNDRDGETVMYFDGKPILRMDMAALGLVDVGEGAKPQEGPFDGDVRKLRLSNGLRTAEWVANEASDPPEPSPPVPVFREPTVFDYRENGGFGRRFDGRGTVSFSPSLLSTNAFTVSMWVYMPNPAPCVLLDAPGALNLQIWSPQWKFFTAVPTGKAAPYARRPYIYSPYVNSHEWLFLSMTFDDCELRVFTNGLGGRPSPWEACPPVTGNLVFGKDFKGYVGRIEFDDHALDEAEMLDRYRAERPRFSDRLVKTIVSPLRYTGVEGREERLPVVWTGDRTAKMSWRLIGKGSAVVASGSVEGDELVVPALGAGEYRLETFPPGDDDSEHVRRSDYRVIRLERPVWKADVRKTPRRLVAAFDPDGVYTAEAFHATGRTNLVRGTCGTYLEAHDGGRLAYRFRADRSKAHVLEFEYPDDKRRDVLFGDALSYNLNAGFAVGGEDAPNSGKMIGKEFLFYPQQDDCVLLVFSKHSDCPAAIGRIRVYELAEAPPGERVEVPSDGGRRLGHAWEDGAIYGSYGINGMPGDRRVLYGVGSRIGGMMAWQGCNMLRWVNWWYGGAHYRSRVCNTYDSHIAADSSEMMRALAPFGVMAQPNYNPLTWPPLLQQTGKINQVRLDGTRQENTGEWNAAPSGVGFSLPGPVFNPQDPVVRTAILDVFREGSRIWGDEPNYPGPSIEWNLSTTLWFGSLDSGYNEGLVQGFEKENGCAIRSKEELLSRKWREKWIDYRCGLVTGLFRDIVAIVRKDHPDRRLTVSMEPGLPIGFHSKDRTLDRIAAGEMSVLDLWRGGGMDLARLNEIEGLQLEWKWVYSANRRWARGRPGWRDVNEEVWRHDGRLRALSRGIRHPSAWCFIRYWENFDTRPSPGFWWKQEYRNHGGAVLGGIHTMKPYVRALAELDVEDLLIGGIVNPNMNDEIALRRFAHAFRSLPRKRLVTVPGSTEDVVVRQGECDGRHIHYAVNGTDSQTEISLVYADGASRTLELPPYDVIVERDAPERVLSSCSVVRKGPAQRTGL